MLQSSSADNLTTFSCGSTDLMRIAQAVLLVVQAIGTAKTTLFDFGAPRVASLMRLMAELRSGTANNQGCSPEQHGHAM